MRMRGVAKSSGSGLFFSFFLPGLDVLEHRAKSMATEMPPVSAADSTVKAAAAVLRRTYNSISFRPSFFVVLSQ